MATWIFYSKDPPLPTHNDEPQVLGKLHTGRRLLERGISHSQTALVINYCSVRSLRRGYTSRSWYFPLPNITSSNGIYQLSILDTLISNTPPPPGQAHRGE